MRQEFNAILTGTDSRIDGIATPVNAYSYSDAYRFTSFDDTLHLTIARDEQGQWHRIDGSEPYLASWTEELAQQIV